MGSSFFPKCLTIKLIKALQNQGRIFCQDLVRPGRGFSCWTRLCPKVLLAGGELPVADICPKLWLHCLGCQKIIAVCDEALADEIHHLGLDDNFEVVAGQLEIFGYCSDCRGKKH